MGFSTTSIARACSRHAGRTFAAWGVVLLGSFAALAFALTGFTTEASGTNDPQSERAHDRFVGAFPPDPRSTVTDLVVVRSAPFTVDNQDFRAFVDSLVQAGERRGAVLNARTYFDTKDGSLVSADRHATLVGINIRNDDATGGVIDEVKRADADPNFDVTITGNRTRDHDFNELSERDLLNGELRFGLPAALIILLLVFGTVVAGMVPL